MKQKDILKLLKQVAKTKGHTEFTQLQIVLGKEVNKERKMQHSTILQALLVQTYLNNPENLPLLFPTIALLCGDRDENVVIAEIDWSLF